MSRLTSLLGPPDEAGSESSPVLSQPEELRDPWLNFQAAPESGPGDRLRRRKWIRRGIASGVIVVTLVASVILFRPHRARIAGLLGQLKDLAVGEASTSDAGQPPEVATSRSKSTLRARRPRQANDELGGGNEASTPSAASPSGEGTTPPPSPLQLEVLESNNQRRLVRLRSGPVLKLRYRAPTGQVQIHWDDTSTAYSPSLESTSLATPGAPGVGDSQEISGGGLEHQEMPAYPPLALQNNVQGTIVLQVLIGKDGSVQNVRLLSGPPMLAAGVMDAVRKWRYKPYYRDGEPVAVEKQITAEFTISSR